MWVGNIDGIFHISVTLLSGQKWISTDALVGWCFLEIFLVDDLFFLFAGIGQFAGDGQRL